MSEDQIKHMVSRFLGWRLPENFSPDCGVHFDADAAKKLNPRNGRFEPSGTNLFDATQAEAMVRYMLDGLPEDNAVGAAEVEVGRYVYRRIEALMGAKAGTPEGAELTYLASLAESIEEYGEEACASHALSAHLDTGLLLGPGTPPDTSWNKRASPPGGEWDQARLRELVDCVWNHVTESTEVPSTKTADKLIAMALSAAPPREAVGVGIEGASRTESTDARCDATAGASSRKSEGGGT